MKQVLAFLAAFALIGAVAAYGHRALDLPAQRTEVHYVVEIPDGASFKQVAGLLAKNGLIISPYWFRLLGKVQDAERRVKPGEYDLHTGMRPPEILDALIKGRTIRYSVLVPEGLTTAQISKLLGETGLVEATGLERLVSDPEFVKALGVAAPTLEGYLFPDTYYFPKRSKADDVLKTMVGRFRQMYTADLQAQAAALRMTERQVLTLASIIEKETGQDDERPLVSAVFHNRLRAGVPLQSDPTVIYDIPNFSGNLTRADLQRSTPSNTYARPGLPPGPIANPGLKSIQAALFPAPVKHLYFVSKNDGTHHFSATIEEHNRAVERFQKRGARHNGMRKAS